MKKFNLHLEYYALLISQEFDFIYKKDNKQCIFRILEDAFIYCICDINEFDSTIDAEK